MNSRGEIVVYLLEDTADELRVDRAGLADRDLEQSLRRLRALDGREVLSGAGHC